MPKNKIIITLGAFIALLPILGFPTSLESFFEVVAGLAIIATSVWSTIDKKLTQKAKAHKRQTQKIAQQDAQSSSPNVEEPQRESSYEDMGGNNLVA